MADTKPTLQEFFNHYFADDSWKKVSSQVDLLVKLVEFFRLKKLHQESKVSLNPLIEHLKNNPPFRENFAAYIRALLNEKVFHAIISDAGISVETDFLFEIKEKLFDKFLPKQPEENNLEYILNQVFYNSTDPEWIEEIEPGEFRILFTLLELKPFHTSMEVTSHLSELLFALEVMTLRVCGNALEVKVMKMVPEYNNLKSPFVAFQNDLSLIEKRILNDENHYLPPDDEDCISIQTHSFIRI